MIVFVSLLSFLLDGILSKYISNNTLFFPLLTIMTLIIIYPYFEKSYKYYRYCAILGLLYDIAYMNTVFYNFFIFILLGLMINFFYYLFSNNLINTIFVSFITIFIYKCINAIFILVTKNEIINFTIFIKNIYSSIILNILFSTIGYIFTKSYSEKHNILRIK